MGNGQNAFAVFSAQRRVDAESLDITQYSYRTPNALFLTHGPYYIEIIASEASERALYSMKMVAENFIRHTVTETVAIHEQNLFPEQDLVANSIALIATDAFGYERLNQIYTAEYELNDGNIMAYLSRRQTPEEAKELAAGYRDFLITFGGQIIDMELSIREAHLVEILDTYEIFFSYGHFMAGVREAAGKEQARQLAMRLYDKLKGDER
jgi:hypothetical protein